MKNILLLLIFCVIALYSDEYQEDGYHFGEGKQIGSLPLYIGGYFSIDYHQREESSRYRIDDIALLSYGNYSNFSYLAEVEFKEFYTYTVNEHNTTTKKDTSPHLERLFLDYNLNENYKFRVGKYNSPIGFWNLLPINVLRDTSSSPVSTNILFPKFTTGLEASYSSYSESEIQVDVLIQHNEDLDSSYNNYEMDEHYAVGVTYSKNDLSLKFNLGAFDSYISKDMTQHLYYILASLKYEDEEYQLMGELGSQGSKNGLTTSYAGYLQGVYHFTQKHSGILRIETYDNKANNLQDNIAIFGYTYRPLYPIAIKSEYQFHTLKNENQFLFSLSVLF